MMIGDDDGPGGGGGYDGLLTYYSLLDGCNAEVRRTKRRPQTAPAIHYKKVI